SPGGIFASRSSATFDNGSGGIYWVQTPDVLTPFGSGVTAALSYVGNSSGAAALQYDGSAGGGKVVLFGFPFETIADENRRDQFMEDILRFFTAPELLVARGAIWKYHDAGVDLGTAWTARAYDDSAWPAGPAQLGFGDDDEATPLVNDPARMTTYFRRSFVVDDARKFRTLIVRLLRDDGAVVWLNGVEVLRNNLPPAGAITWATSAEVGLSGAAESTFSTYTLDARALRTGTNILAVEIHQFGTTSTDLSFDLELTAIRDSVSTLVGSRSTWKYRDTGVPPAADWMAPNYDDLSWASGPARLGYGGDGEATTLAFGSDAANKHRTSWFRQHFKVTDATMFDALRLELQRDDGAIVYLNGVELLRDNLPSSTADPGMFATAEVAGAEEVAWQSFIVPASALSSGTNVLAVEVHQASPASSDLGFDLRLFGLTQAAGSFAAWQAAHFGSDRTNAVLAAELANPDRDIGNNLLEYALSGSPTVSDDSPLTSLDATSGRLALRFERNTLAADVTLTVQGADDLSGPWLDLARSSGGNRFEPLQRPVTVLESPAGAFRTVEVRDIFAIDDPAHPRRFLRLQSTK
ncbi:MAG TPA: hypothetical protein VGO90_06270, partial [Chthoniobacteraceae bacterium]|nr:hypothetical protein [Chthoniobacteraceae bacterium]